LHTELFDEVLERKKSYRAPLPEPPSLQSDESPVYAGPNFDELDQAVQNSFYEYLGERGVDDALAERLADFAQAKELSEYIAWLDGVRAFAK
jgi:hypothetical protein